MNKPNISQNIWMGSISSLFAGLFLIMCNTVEPIKVGSIILKLDDSLTVEAGRFDTLSIDILDTTGAVRIPKAFYGEFSTKNNGEISGIPLGDNPPAHYVIRIIGFKDGKPDAIYHISVSAGQSSSLQPIPLPAVELLSLAFDPPTLSLAVGETSAAIFPKASPINASNSVLLTLSDSSKATVLPGNLIRAEAEGPVLVTATSLLNPGIQANLSLSISSGNGRPHPVTVQISKRNLILAFGGPDQDLIAPVKPDAADQRVIWTSSNTGIASVEGGKVSPISIGKTWIKVQAGTDSAVTDSIPVEVLIPEPLDSIRISRESTRFFMNGAGQKITFTSYPIGSRSKVNWVSGDESIIRIDTDGGITARSPGVTRIKAIGIGNPAIADSMEITVVRDPPKLNAGPTQNIDPGTKATFNVSVEQEFGGIASLKWDLDGDGIIDGSSASASAIAEMTYPAEKREYLASFKAEDGEGNTDSISVRVRVGFNTPLIIVTKPTRDTLVNNPAFTVAYTVDGAAKTKEFVLAKEGRNRLVISETKAAGTDSAIVYVDLDTQAPVVKILSPVTGMATNKSTLQVDWTVDSVAQIQQTEEDISAQEGEITLTRRATDAAGNTGTSSVTIFRDVTKPAIVFTSPKNGDTITTNPVTVAWTVDGKPQTTQLIEALSGPDGEKTITRKATDSAGNSDSASIKVILDMAKPAAPIFTLPATAVSSTRSRKPTWTWKTGGGDSGAGFRYQLGTAAPVQLPGTTFTPATDLADGTYVLKVAEKDAAGNWSTDAVSTVTVKGSAPAAPKLTVNAAISNAPKWTWSGTTGATFGYKLKGAASFISEGTATSYQPNAAQMGEGLKTLCVSEKDILGYGPESCLEITVDRTLPAIAITSDVSAELMVTSVNPTFSGTAGDTHLDRVECKAGTAATVNATISAGIWSCTPPLGDGDINVTFTAFDKAANTASAAAVTVHKRSKVKFVRKGKTGGNGTSWAKAWGDIRDALTTSVSLNAGDEVWVSAGTYESIGAGAYKFTSNTSLVGGFSNAGAPFNRSDAKKNNLVQMDPADMRIGSESEPINNLTIFGITFNGQLTNTDVATSRVYIYYSLGIVIDNCTFTSFSRENSLVSHDIPLLISHNSNVTVKSSTFQNNFPGAYGAIMVGFNGWGATAEFINCTITDNTSNNGSFSGGITIGQASSVTLTSSTLSGNKISTTEWPSEDIIRKPMNIHVFSSGQLFHSGLVLPEGGSTISGEGIISPPFHE